MQESFSQDSIIQYNKENKKKFVINSIIIILSTIIFGLSYYFFIRNIDFFLINTINFLIDGVIFEIKDLSYLGIFYLVLFGGFFLVFMPLEVIFISLISSDKNPFFILFLYLVGLFISYNINYLVGYKLGNFSKKMITYKKFYSIKKMLNKHGALAIFFFNFLPLPSQPFSTILGVFKYNLIKFYGAFLGGQFLKYFLISITYIYIF